MIIFHAVAIAQKNSWKKKQPETIDYTSVNQVWLRPVAEKTARDYIDYTSVNQVWPGPAPICFCAFPVDNL